MAYTPRKCQFINLRIEEFGYAGIDIDWTAINIFYQNLFVRRCGRFGIKVGVDCDVSHCFIGENGVKYPNDFYNCNILVAGGDTRITDCHIWGWGAEKGILIDWSSDVHISNCVIEEHSKEGIFIYNSSTCRIYNNYLEDNSYGNPNVYSAIKIVGNYQDNLSYYNQIIGNRFGKQIWGGIQAGHKYCVEEEGSYVDYTYFANNYVYAGYQTDVVYFVGSHSFCKQDKIDDDLKFELNLIGSYNTWRINTNYGFLKFRSRPETRASEANVLIMGSYGRAGLQVVRDMRGNPYRGHAFEIATLYDNPYPDESIVATGLRFMVGHSVDDETADVYPLVRIYAQRLNDGRGKLLFQLNTTGQEDWDGGHIATKFGVN